MRTQDDIESKIMVTQSSMPPLEEYVEMIKPLWDSRWLTNMGQLHAMLEKRLKEYFGGKREISLMVNGHMALELAIQSMNFPIGSEIITTPYTFISTTHAIIRNGLKPVFCDVQENYTIDVPRIENLVTEKTVAIVPVHVYGNICDVEALERIAYKYGLKVIYDAAHAFGETYKGKSVAEFGDMSVFSFHATKVFHSIEGGAVSCSTKEQYEKLYNLKNFGIRSPELTVEIGANAKMNEFSAAMGLCNLKYLPQQIKKRKKITELYEREFMNDSRIQIIKRDPDVTYNYGYFPIWFPSEQIRDKVFENLRKNNIFTRKYFYPITSDAACFKNKFKNDALDHARDYSKRVLVLPLYADLEYETVQNIIELVRKGLNE